MASGDSVIIKIDGDDSGFRKSLEGIGDVAQKGLGIVTKGVAAAGAALVTATGYAVNFANNVKKASNDFQAATGIAGEAAQGFEDAMLRIYNNNFGESLEDISDAMATVAQTTQEMDPSKIEGMTQNALALRDTFGFDIQEQIRAANMLMDQFGVTGEEAFNLIAQGAQGGLDKNGDLLDSINEYSVHFKSLGLDVEDMFNSLKNGAAAGTFSVDKLGDTIKEFGIRAKDGSDSTKEAFKTLGLDVDATSAAFAAGGDKAEQAFQNVINSLFNMQDPLAQNTVGVALFGTMWEDLGVEGVKALTNLNGEISTSKDALAQINEIKYDDFGSAISGLGRILQTSFVLPIGEQVLPLINDFINTLSYGVSDAKNFTEIVSVLGGAISDAAAEIALAMPDFIEIGISLINSILIGVQNNIPKLVPAATSIINTLLSEISRLIPQVMDTGAQLLESIFTEVPNILQNAAEVATEIVSTFVTKLAELTPEVIKACGDMLVAVVNDIPTIIDTIVDRIPEIIAGMIYGFLSAQTQFSLAGVKLIFGLVMDAPGIIAALLKAVPPIIQGFIDGILLYVQDMWTAGKALIGGLITGAEQEGQRLATAVFEWFNGLIINIETIISNIKQSFVNGWDSICNFLGVTVPNLVSDIGIWFNKLPGKVGEALGYALGVVSRWGVDLYNNAVSAVQNCIHGIGEWFEKLPENIGDWLTETISKIKQWGESAYTSCVNAAFSCVHGIGEWFANLPGDIWNWLSGAYNKMKQWGNDLIAWAQSQIPIVIQNIVSFFEELPGKMLQIGKNLINGLWEGIISAGSWLKNKISEFCNGVINGFEKAFKINSPSKVMRDEVGISIPEGIAVGIQKGIPIVNSSIDDLVKQSIDTAQKRIERENSKRIGKDEIGTPLMDGVAVAIQENSWEVSEEFEKLMDDLELQRDLGVISEAEYYRKLESYRDGYLEKGTKEWWDYTKKIAEYEQELVETQKDNIEELYTNTANAAKEHLEEMANSTLESISEIESAQESLASKLKETGNATYETVTTVIGDDETSYTRLADMSADNSLLEKYNNALDALFQKRGELPEDVMQSLSEMGAEEGLAYANALLSASDAEYSKYIQDLQEKQRLAEEIGKKVYSSQTEELMAEFEKEWGKVPEDFFAIGEDSAQQYGEGFMAQLKSVFERVRTEITNSMSGLQPNMQFATAAVGTGTSHTYTDNRSTVIYANSTSPHAIIEAQKQSEIYQQHTKKWE